MRWLSESVEVLADQELLLGGKPKVHDAVVVGSGYGGAVAALRLAERGVRVLVLERGKEYVSGDFPNDIGQAFGHVRIERDAGANVEGYESGLYDLRLGENIGALVGNALGGTSQINASVVLAPDRRVFDKLQDAHASAWPTQLRPMRGRFPRSLLKGYAAARRTLKPELFTDTIAFNANADAPGGAAGVLVKPLKTQRLGELGSIIRAAGMPDVEVAFRPAHLTVDLNKPGRGPVEMPLTSGCVGCGDCVSGCNENAKRTLTTTYLPRAYERGARMFTGATVLSVRREGAAWVLRFVRTDARKSMREGGNCPVHELHAKHVVLSAGTFGSTEILLRSRDEHGLALSGQLGKRLSTNGDSLSFGYLGKERVNGIGVGASALSGSGFAVGPTITGMVRIDHKSDVSKSMLIQDGAVPHAVSRLFEEMVAATGALTQLDHWRFRDMPRAGQQRDDTKDWAVLQPRGRSHTQTLLGIGHDLSQGDMELDGDRLRIRYDKDAIEPIDKLHEAYLSMVEKQGAIYLRNPALHPLPRNVSGVLSGPAMGGGAFTVHPLGGCCMADEAALGVVDHLGRVFKSGVQAPGEPSVHPGLYVLDGSIVPTSLGANPLFTIAALAERAMHALAPGIEANVRAQEPTPRPLNEHPAHQGQDFNPHAREVDVHFTEAMRARKEDFQWQGKPMAAHLLLHLPVNDLELFATDGHHRITIPSQSGSMPGSKERLQACLRIDPDPYDAATALCLIVESGWVSILPVPETVRLRAASLWVRTLLTWFILRGRDEIVRYLLQALRILPKEASEQEASGGFWSRFWSLLKLCGHASESRVMAYKVQLLDSQPRGDSVRAYTLRGIKKVGYPASWRAIGRYVWQRGRAPLERANVWASFGELEVDIKDEDERLVGQGRLSLDMLDMTRMHAPQLALARDTPNALLGLAAYPFWFARLLAKTRLWDFRLPDYPSLIPKELTGGPRDHVPVPAVDVADPPSWWPPFPALRIWSGVGVVMQCVDAQTLDFKAPRLSGDENPADQLNLKLTRYRQSALRHGRTAGAMTQFKTILLMGGLGQSTLSFLAPELVRKPGKDDDEPALAEFFYEQGFDVWLLDYRLSPHLDASKLPSNLDQVARFDIPRAVDQILAALASEHGVAFDDAQIYAYGHCVGAAALAMSLLGGMLKHASGADKIAGVAFSQMQAITIGSRSLQMRIRLSAVARDMLDIDYLRLSPVERAPTAMEAALDRLFASLPVAPGQACPHERSRHWPRPAICTCRRLSGIISPVINHARIKPETHDKLAVYFGRANTSVLAHGARCVENERLVDADGQNVYLAEVNIRKHLRLPVALIHGKASALFDVESALQTFKRIGRINPDLRQIGAYARPILAEGFAHFDCVVGCGKDMQEQILQPLRRFFDEAWELQASVAMRAPPETAPARFIYPKDPLAGPTQGWSRIEPRAGKPTRIARFWIEVDESGTDKADWVLTQCRWLRGSARPDSVRLWPVIRVPLRAWAGRPDVADLAQLALGDDEPYIAVAIADLEFDLTQSWNEDLSVRMFSLHTSGPLPVPAAPPSPTQANHYWEVLSQEFQKGREMALRADPGTVSRRRRSLALPWTYGLPQATLKAEALHLPDPSAGVGFVAASCRHPGLAFEDRRADAGLERVSRFLSADCLRPAFMLMLGDQIYADATAGLMDSPSAIEKIVLRHRQAFTTAAFADLTSSIPTYMAIDDHEIGDNWSRDELSAPGGQRLYETARAAFTAYQWAHSPRNGAAPGFNCHFEENGCSFFVLDTRTQRLRHPGGGAPQVCAPQQISALLGWLMCRENDARPKFIVSGSVFAPGLCIWDSGVAGLSERYAESWQLAQQQRVEVLSFIAERQIKNVVFVAGDYHCCATAQIDLGAGLRAFAVVTPPLYAQMPAANVKPADVMAHETIGLRGGRVARIEAQAHGGDGFADIRATPTPNGRWRLEVRHHLLTASDKTPHPHIAARCFLLD